MKKKNSLLTILLLVASFLFLSLPINRPLINGGEQRIFANMDLYAQTVAQPSAEGEQQTTPAVTQELNPEVNIDLGSTFGSLAGLSAVILFCTSFLKKWLKTNDSITILLSGLIGIVLSAAGFVFHLGIFDALEWYYIFIYGLAATVIANGFSTWEVISKILTAVKLKTPRQ